MTVLFISPLWKNNANNEHIFVVYLLKTLVSSFLFLVTCFNDSLVYISSMEKQCKHLHIFVVYSFKTLVSAFLLLVTCFNDSLVYIWKTM